MRIVIVGPGAMGCLFAGIFAEHGQDVWLLDKDPARAAAIARNGVCIDDESGSRVVRVRITASAGDIGSAGMICLCVKSYDTGAAVRHALPLAGPETVVVSLQNGAGNAERMAEVIDHTRILCGVTAYGSTTIGDGHVRHAGTGPTTVASFAPEQRKKAKTVADLLTKAGINTTAADDWQSVIWSKLIINAAINPLTVIANVRNGGLLTDPDLKDKMRKAALEAVSVAKAKGISPAYSDAAVEVEKVCRATANNFSSMLQDVRKGRRTEIDSINGVIVREARAAGIEAPVNEMLLKRVLSTEGKQG